MNVKREIIVLVQLILASLALFFVAHVVLFKLHLPSRYTQHSLRIVLALATAIALTILIDSILQWAKQPPRLAGRQILALATATALGCVLIMYPKFLPNLPRTKYKVGEVPALYEFFFQHPKNILIAFLTDEADNLPTFARRSVLVSREYAIPYHTGYYRPFRQRITDLIQAQYSPNGVEVKDFINRYGIDFWLLDQAAFTPEYIAQNPWFKEFQPTLIQA